MFHRIDRTTEHLDIIEILLDDIELVISFNIIHWIIQICELF